MKKPLASNLSQHILLALSVKPANSIAALARDLGALRPSVSRAVNSLQTAGLLTRDKRFLSLTQIGRREAEHLNAQLPAKVKKDIVSATHIFEQATKTWRTIEPCVNNTVALQALKSFDIGVARQAAQFAQVVQAFDTGVAKQAAQFAQVVQAFDTGVARQAAAQLAQAAKVFDTSSIGQIMEAINATAQIQTLNLDCLRLCDQQVLFPVSHLLIENNVFISRMMVDLDAIGRVIVELNRPSEMLRQQVAAVAKAYDTYFQDVGDVLAQNAALANTVVDELRTDLLIPTTSTSTLISSARNILEFQAISQMRMEQTPFESTRVRVHSEQYIDISAKLESYLSPLDKRFVNKWHGAWQTLFSQSEDRYCQAIHSGRELLIQLLEYLAPNDRFTKEDFDKHSAKAPTHRMQAKYILGECKKPVDWVDKMAAAIDSMYDILTAESHSRDNSSYDDDTAASLLISLGGLLLFILKKRINRSS